MGEVGEAREAGRRGMERPQRSHPNSPRNLAPGPGMALISLTVHFPQTFSSLCKTSVCLSGVAKLPLAAPPPTREGADGGGGRPWGG